MRKYDYSDFINVSQIYKNNTIIETIRENSDKISDWDNGFERFFVSKAKIEIIQTKFNNILYNPRPMNLLSEHSEKEGKKGWYIFSKNTQENIIRSEFKFLISMIEQQCIDYYTNTVIHKK